ncbi:ABC transporter ATP-binding protein [Salinirussus salinus]|uniref:ABC transporter ATP-binding protein n=1 Tax=Salinirussus salinus TaxID=1198300 RepID=UPI00135712F2|nr:ABC transporter ATP-binding protein [Salinirussus salinus]
MDDETVDTEDISARQKLRAIVEVATHRPLLSVGIIVFGVTTAALEGVGLGFILPIIQVAQGQAEPSGLAALFASFYDAIGVPFTLEYIIAGVGAVLAVRYAAAFAVQWLRGILEAVYVRHLRDEAFRKGLDARVSYFDQQGSDEILNAIITQTQYAGRAIQRTVRVLELVLVGGVYVLIAMYIAPTLTLVTGIVMGGFVFGVRRVLESGTSVGSRVADANERVQEAIQAGMQGIRDVKLFNMEEELYKEFKDSVDQFVRGTIDQRRNQSVIRNVNDFAIAATIFGLIYLGLRVFSLSLGSLGLFLFAMFRLGPKVSNMNDVFYGLEADLPHLVRTQRFTERLEARAESSSVDRPIESVDTVEFNNVSFSYETSNEQVLDGVSFSVDRGEFIGFVGQSGAGKSTIVSLLARLYDPDEGEILANGTPIKDFDISEWRDRVSVVRQDPFVFNDTLRTNITIGNRDATQTDVERVAKIARVTEFLDELPNGYDTILGDNGVRLSGGQRQRVAIARALLKDADLLILDEATSDLDTHLEEEVHQAIESMERNYGMIGIAHRLSTVTGADQIITMSDGKIVEQGSHDELLSKGGQYAGLYTSQS